MARVDRLADGSIVVTLAPDEAAAFATGQDVADLVAPRGRPPSGEPGVTNRSPSLAAQLGPVPEGSAPTNQPLPPAPVDTSKVIRRPVGAPTGPVVPPPAGAQPPQPAQPAPTAPRPSSPWTPDGRLPATLIASQEPTDPGMRPASFRRMVDATNARRRARGKQARQGGGR